MNKRIVIVLFYALCYFSLSAKEKIDNVIARAAEDIVQKCDAKSILVIDDFESPTQKMTL